MSQRVKKASLTVLLGIIFGISVQAQVVTFEPSFATENDSLIITFDATQGDGGLQGFTGDVYLHTGVITNQSTSPTDWRYVPNDWSTYPAKVKATSLGNNKWEFKYLPSIREFFGVTDPTEEVLEVAMLFRGTNTGSGDPVAVGRGDGGADIYVELTQGENSAKWLTPGGENTLVVPGDSVEFTGIGTTNTGTLSLAIKVNGIEVASSLNDTLSYTLHADVAGNYEVLILAENGLGDADSVLHKVVAWEQQSSQRPNGLRDGITYESDGSVSLSLFAPGKDNVFVIGDFNDWQIDFDYAMQKDSLNPDSVWFWANLDQLLPGMQYGFQYLVDQQQAIADPYSPLLLHQNDDPWIPSSVFPNLKEYPAGKTTGYVGLLEPGKAEYLWEAPDFQKPDKESLVIYELLIRDFLSDHSYTSLIDSLDYLERLGVNAIELMPVSEYDGNESWGYNPASHIALDKYYGTPDAFKSFVDEAHKRGIAVILDVVLNHATGHHSLYQLYNFGSNPYFNTEPKHSYNVFNDFNHQYSGTQYYTKRMIEHWIYEYKIDGFRWDLTKGFTQNCSANDEGCTGSYQQDRVDLLKKYADYQWAADSTFYVIFEHLGTDTEEQQWANYRNDEGKGIMLWGNMNYAYNEATMGWITNSDFSRVRSSTRGFNKKHLVGYMESHDEQWLMFKNRSFGNSSGEYDVRDLNTALGRQKLAGAFFLTIPGPKMIWQFGELGYGYGNNGEQCLKPGSGSDGDCAPSVADRVGNKPIRWDYWISPDTPERIKLYKTWAALIKLRNSSPAFTDPETEIYNLGNVVKRITLEHSDSDVVVIGNFGVTARTVSVDYTQTGTWYDYFEGTEVDVTDINQTVTLSPGEFKVFTTKQFETPEMGISVPNEITERPGTFRLHQNYPNPFNPETIISFELGNDSQVTLEVFDMLGRRVATLINSKMASGTHSVTFDASQLSSGVYITRLKAGQRVFVNKMTLMK